MDQERLDLHNTSVDTALAVARRCGTLHLASGRVCLLPARHQGPCQFRPHRSAGGSADRR